MDLIQEVEQLRRIPLFARVETARLKLLAFTSRLLEFADGEAIFRAGDAADSVYLIMGGEVDILDPREDSESAPPLVRGEGALIGEIAVLSRTVRTASVRARGQVQILRIEEDAFLELLSCQSTVALDVMRQLSDKLMQAYRAQADLQRRLSTSSGQP